MREERGMDNAPQCLWNGYIVMAASLAQNNPDSEYTVPAIEYVRSIRKTFKSVFFIQF